MPTVNSSSGGNHIVNFTPTLIGRHDAMFDVASLCFDSVSGLRLAVAGLENLQVSLLPPDFLIACSQSAHCIKFDRLLLISLKSLTVANSCAKASSLCL